MLANADLQLRSASALADTTLEQLERIRVIFDMLISLSERAYLMAWKPKISPTEQRRWNAGDDDMREWCRHDDFYEMLPVLLRGEDLQFQAYIQRLAQAERGSAAD